MGSYAEEEILRPLDLGRSAMEVSHLYGFLARFFREEVTSDLLRELKSPKMKENLAAAGVVLEADIVDQPEAEVLERLAVEFTALFLGPGGHISPHESTQTEENGLLWGEQTVAVRSFIEQSGFRYQESFTGIPDHISVELEYLAALAEIESSLWLKGDSQGAANALEYQRDFLDAHLGKWVERFCNRVNECACEKLYRDIAILTRDFVVAEMASVAQRLAAANDISSETALPLQGAGAA